MYIPCKISVQGRYSLFGGIPIAPVIRFRKKDIAERKNETPCKFKLTQDTDLIISSLIFG